MPVSDRADTGAFTLIELLVVIGIIGILMSVVVASMSGIRAKASNARFLVETKPLLNAFRFAQENSRSTLLQITGSGCSDCACRTGTSLKNVPTSDPCYVGWVNALNRVMLYQTSLDITTILRDQWGSPYLLDENEREVGPTYCVNDTFKSAGPDGIAWNSDDLTILIPFSICPN
jgi:prepilin-type N-terminal cleavage/methylation domain-containing protein